jgi:hypothetical protein
MLFIHFLFLHLAVPQGTMEPRLGITGVHVQTPAYHNTVPEFQQFVAVVSVPDLYTSPFGKVQSDAHMSNRNVRRPRS